MALQHNAPYNTENFAAASAIPQFAAVRLSASTAFQVLIASGASAGIAPVYGLAIATMASPNGNIPIQTGGLGKGIAGASLGIGAFVGAGLGTHALVPIAASGVASAVGAAGIQYPQQIVGTAIEAAAAGAIFTVSIRPRQVV